MERARHGLPSVVTANGGTLPCTSRDSARLTPFTPGLGGAWRRHCRVTLKRYQHPIAPEAREKHADCIRGRRAAGKLIDEYSVACDKCSR